MTLSFFSFHHLVHHHHPVHHHSVHYHSVHYHSIHYGAVHYGAVHYDSVHNNSVHNHFAHHNSVNPCQVHHYSVKMATYSAVTIGTYNHSLTDDLSQTTYDMSSSIPILDHYPGFRTQLRLLYTSQSSSPRPYQHGFPLHKQISVIGDHSIVPVFDTHICEPISKLNISNSMESIYVVRIGYQATLEDPAIILVVTKQGMVGIQAASVLGQEIKNLCTG